MSNNTRVTSLEKFAATAELARKSGAKPATRAKALPPPVSGKNRRPSTQPRSTGKTDLGYYLLSMHYKTILTQNIYPARARFAAGALQPGHAIIETFVVDSPASRRPITLR